MEMYQRGQKMAKPSLMTNSRLGFDDLEQRFGGKLDDLEQRLQEVKLDNFQGTAP